MEPEEINLSNQIEGLLNDQPCFAHDGRKIEFINEPHQFYQRIVALTSLARRRIILSSLYYGNGAKEIELVNRLKEAKINRDVEIRILIDYARGTRKPNSSCDVLQPLLDESNQVQIHLYHTMALSGWLKWLLPNRWNEIIGLQHMKVYIFDDTVLISGANISNTYFTNRQDRCIEIQDCRNLANFYADIIDTMAQNSFRLYNDGRLELDCRCEAHPYKDAPKTFSRILQYKLHNVMESWKTKTLSESSTNTDVVIYPYLQYGHSHIYTEYNFLNRLFTMNVSSLTIWLASGYFNLLRQYSETIASDAQATIYLMAASPEANGFYKANGISGSVPLLYCCAMKEFLSITRNAIDRVYAYEWRKSGWSYHAKGLWFSTKSGEPFGTVIGSSNYGYRSVERDVETGILLLTKNPNLRAKMAEEKGNLIHYCTQLTLQSVEHNSDYYAPFWVRLIFRFARRFF